MAESKVKIYKGFVIAKSDGDYEYLVYTAEEWGYGAGYRTAEFECCSVQECMENIDSY